MDRRCCFRQCDATGGASLRLELLPHPDMAPVVLWAHPDCFSRVADSSVGPDDPKDHGRIPGRARCVLCRGPLPVVGRHPLVLLIGTDEPRDRYWIHAECVPGSFVDSVGDAVGIRG